MERMEFIKQIEELEKKQKEIKQEINLLKLKYIEENKSFEIGDRVKTKRGEIGIVYNFDLDYKDEVKPLMWKEKKDGSASKFKLNIYYASDIVGLADIF